MENKTYVLVKPEQAANKNVLTNEWICRKKAGKNGCIVYKARLVVKGYKQVYGVDYFDTFAPVVRFETLRALLLLAGLSNYDVWQFDVVTAFLNAALKEEIYMKQPDGFVQRGRENWICKLQRSLYGLKQAPRCWNSEFDHFLRGLNFKRSCKDFGLYFKYQRENDDDENSPVFLILVTVYVDDILVFCPEGTGEKFITALKNRFKIKKLGQVSKLLGIQIDYVKGNYITFSQSEYVQKILKKIKMEDCNPVFVPLVKSDESQLVLNRANEDLPYAELVGSLQYLVSGSRPDLACAVRVLAQQMGKFTLQDWKRAKLVLKYLKGTLNFGIVMNLENGLKRFREKQGIAIETFTDADYANEKDRKSITGFVTQLCGQFISGKSWKQSILAESTTEAELIAANTGSHDAVWLKQLLEELQLKIGEALIRIDNRGALEIAKHPTNHKRTKQIDVRFLKIREYVENGTLQVESVPSADNVADIMTKPLVKVVFEKHRNNMSVKKC